MISRSVSIIDPDTNYAAIIQNLLSQSTPHRYFVKNHHKDLSQLRNLKWENPDLVLLELAFDGVSFEDLIYDVKRIVPSSNIIVLTAHFNPDVVIKALRAGADGYIIKTLDFHSVVATLNESYHGGASLSRMAARAVVENFRPNNKSVLTPRESEIMSLVSHCKSYSEISQHLSIGKETARKHIRNIYKKLKVHKKSEAIKIARQEKFIIA